jgi:predicted O-methyltransferase YrrM
MAEENWNDVDAFIGEKLLPADPVLDAVLKANRAAGLPNIDVSPAQGKFLQLIARLAGAKTILEIGTLGGYSTVWLARALPDGGKIVTLESSEGHSEVARANFAAAGVADKVDLRVGPALYALPALEAEKQLFDVIFIDADKSNNLHYLRWALKLSRAGTVIVVDNVVRQGRIIDEDDTSPEIEGTRRFFDFASQDKRWTATALQTVGVKGWDGFAIGIVEEAT